MPSPESGDQEIEDISADIHVVDNMPDENSPGARNEEPEASALDSNAGTKHLPKTRVKRGGGRPRTKSKQAKMPKAKASNPGSARKKHKAGVPVANMTGSHSPEDDNELDPQPSKVTSDLATNDPVNQAGATNGANKKTIVSLGEYDDESISTDGSPGRMSSGYEHEIPRFATRNTRSQMGQKGDDIDEPDEDEADSGMSGHESEVDMDSEDAVDPEQLITKRRPGRRPKNATLDSKLAPRMSARASHHGARASARISAQKTTTTTPLTAQKRKAVAPAKRVGRPAKQPRTTKSTKASSTSATLPNEYTVERILDSMRDGRTNKLKYCIKWQGYPDNQNTWEPEENLHNCQKMVEEFEKEQDRKETAATKTGRATKATTKAAPAKTRGGSTTIGRGRGRGRGKAKGGKA